LSDFDDIERLASDIIRAATPIREGRVKPGESTRLAEEIIRAAEKIKRAADDAESDYRRERRTARGED
jgi:hypothetical protein